MRPTAVLASLLLLNIPAPGGADGDRRTFFREQIRPILQRCVRCHSGDEPAGSLNLTTRALALKGGESGPALRPGKASESLLHALVSARKMPPKQPLSPEQIALLRRWIDAGAAWDGTVERKRSAVAAPKRAGPDWWSLQQLRRPAVPAVKDTTWARNPIDGFVLAALEAKQLRPAPAADRITLLRRATFDLTGLPPTPAEIDAFLSDTAPDAWEKVVDRLLAAGAYGERWGRHWLDVARFGESQGFERDKPRDHAWRYRDYVIHAFNDDKPYPQFVKEQIAGDVLGPDVPEGVIATGFLVAGPWDEVGATQQSLLMRRRVREEELEDMVSATAQTFLGLTVNCARCHNHKFDPITQKDYYRLKAALEGVRPGDRPIRAPVQARLREEIARLEKEVAALEAEGRRKVPPHQRAGEKELPAPLARWSFESDARDYIGGLHGTLEGGAVVANGRLKLNGRGAFVRTSALPRNLRARTLEAWVTLASLEQRGGGVMSVQTRDGRVFDAIVFGERQPRRWIAGSSSFQRTRDLAGPPETAAPSDLVHVAVVYGPDNSIAVYRNGAPYAAPYVPSGTDSSLRTYAANESHVLFGLRHTGAGNGYFAGEVAEARLYDRALTAREVTASFRAGVERIPLERVLRALTPGQRQRRARILAELATMRRALGELAASGLVYAVNPSRPEPTYLLVRGDVEKKGELVSAGGLSAVRSPSPEWGLAADAPEGQRRLKLAEWIAAPDNPLTFRVLVNRVWMLHFGRGLVETPSDFGFNGGRPSHPELLDWLASEFVENGGSIKKLQRLLLLSSSYRQGSRLDARGAALDATNRLLWRFAPRRLEGEAVRDAMLAVSGELNRESGGPSFRPFKVTVFNSTFYTLTDPLGPEYNRRTVYRMNINSAKSPLLDAFDCPDPSVKTPRRSTTTTPLQALGLMNNRFVLRQAKHFAQRVRGAAKGDTAAEVAWAYRLAFGRQPRADEAARAVKLVGEHGLESLCWVLLNASEFLYSQ